MTLEPGDLIVTGTPSGAGIARGRFLNVGDVVRVQIEHLGTNENTVRAEP
jgi:2-keto-4-pentenoate hydratase/2-oxohepta-3-ene-1,7-dioic acid hydratase in catechol pathway